jgi:sulfur carrier protein
LNVSILNILIMAKIQLNGSKLKLNKRYSIFTLLKKYKIDGKKIAVELNGKIVSRIGYKLVYLKNKDKVEIVHFIGGG